MSSPLIAKRRKLNNASNALTKPFVSPLKTPQSTAPGVQGGSATTTTTPYQPSTLAHTIIIPQDIVHTSIKTTKTAPTPTRLNHLRRPNTHTPSALRPTTSIDPAEKSAQRALTTLELRIRTTRNEIDALKQAIRLSNSTTDSDLDELTLKWRTASQSTAEELFGTVKERVNRMGGVQAWREAEKAKVDRRKEWEEQGRREMEEKENDDECYVDAEGEDLPEEEVEWRLKEKERVRRERKEAAEEEKDMAGEQGGGGQGEPPKMVWEEPGREDDCFTMDMMLRMMGVDMKLIGWNVEDQVWVS